MKHENPIYLDHAATTPTDPRVVEAMLPYFSEIYGNPSSTHQFGQKAERALDAARDTVARILNCAPHVFFYNTGGTESDNLALRGVALMARHVGKSAHIIAAHTEHHAV